MTSIFGDVIDAGRVEDALRETLEAWLPSHLAHQEDENDLAYGTIDRPRSWPTVSEFELQPHEMLPSVVVVSQGTAEPPERDQRGRYRVTWRFDLAVAVAADTERSARKLAAMYLAAIRSAVLQNGTLGGVAEATNWQADSHTYASTDRGARAVYGMSIAVVVRSVVSSAAGPAEPPPDPFHPPEPPEPFETADITVTPEPLT